MIALDFKFTPLGTHSASWTVPENLDYFDGHFPNNPVLPAVAVVDISLEYLRQILGDSRLEIKSIRSSKFMMPVTPLMTVRLTVRPHANRDSAENRWEVEWQTEQQTAAAKLDLVLQ